MKKEIKKVCQAGMTNSKSLDKLEVLFFFKISDSKPFLIKWSKN